VVAELPTADRVGRCTLTISSATATVVVVYGYYSPIYTAGLAAEACVALHGAFDDRTPISRLRRDKSPGVMSPRLS
jgi:hypothetical protein